LRDGRKIESVSYKISTKKEFQAEKVKGYGWNVFLTVFPMAVERKYYGFE
jgi:hypothetical protein